MNGWIDEWMDGCWMVGELDRSVGIGLNFNDLAVATA
ncbi:hypothetical protein DFQ01_11497 [Paenibacillus cellulosilyticus]|uniref:Uncharacterized protein n=1 Tax=Paenibacillus cellulosilyticus TaxID=375489 RepID=A0A2V2YTE1_9BACL|nr:hypothetical protein DFQ01_11497 [Paenibacillus cellulosilyticus]